MGLATRTISTNQRRRRRETKPQRGINAPAVAQAVKAPTGEPITISMASMPERQDYMLQVIDQLLPQCTQLIVTLNSYAAVPKAMPNAPGKLCVLRAGEGHPYPDRGALAKFYLPPDLQGYHLTVDDDITYPPNYVSSMITAVNKYERRAVVGIHGMILQLEDAPGEDYREHRKLFIFHKKVGKDVPVHVLGTGAMAYHRSLMSVQVDDINEEPYCIDDQLALYAQQHMIPFIALKHDAGWLGHNRAAARESPLCKRDYIRAAKNRRFHGHKPWVRYSWQGGVVPDAVTGDEDEDDSSNV